MEELLNQSFKLARQKGYLVQLENGKTLEEQLKRDMIEFSLWIANSDSKIDRAELITIARTLGVELDDEFKVILEDVKNKISTYLDDVPLSVKYFAEVDKKENINSEWLNNTRFIYKTFKQIGCIIIACNGSRVATETSALNKFCDKFINYVITIEQQNSCMDLHQQREQMLQNKKESQDLIEKTNNILEEVNGLIGLGNVKREINNLVNLLLVYKYREERGLKNPPLAMHFVFTGNPGTGKTTIARWIAKIYKELGIIEGGQLVEADRSALVAGYVGQTAEKVNNIVDKAMGGVLFIDEAYTLVSKSENDFGQEAIDILLKRIEDSRDKFVTIVAGYPKEMEDFLNSNPGLRSRFNKSIEFENYSVEELILIFEKMCKEYDFIVSDTAKAVLADKFAGMLNKPGFANAREVRNYFEVVVNKHANRMMQIGLSSSNSQLQTIDINDL